MSMLDLLKKAFKKTESTGCYHASIQEGLDADCLECLRKYKEQLEKDQRHDTDKHPEGTE